MKPRKTFLFKNILLASIFSENHCFKNNNHLTCAIAWRWECSGDMVMARGLWRRLTCLGPTCHGILCINDSCRSYCASTMHAVLLSIHLCMVYVLPPNLITSHEFHCASIYSCHLQVRQFTVLRCNKDYGFVSKFGMPHLMAIEIHWNMKKMVINHGMDKQYHMNAAIDLDIY